MAGEYQAEANAKKLIYAKDLPGLPNDIALSFNNAYIRFYNSEEDKGYFRCSFALPTLTDDQGYVIELDFSPETTYEDNVDSSFYESPLNNHSFDNLSKAVKCHFEEKVEMGKRMLLLFMKIKNTTFDAYVYIPEDTYVRDPV